MVLECGVTTFCGSIKIHHTKKTNAYMHCCIYMVFCIYALFRFGRDELVLLWINFVFDIHVYYG